MGATKRAHNPRITGIWRFNSKEKYQAPLCFPQISITKDLFNKNVIFFILFHKSIYTGGYSAHSSKYLRRALYAYLCNSVSVAISASNGYQPLLAFESVVLHSSLYVFILKVNSRFRHCHWVDQNIRTKNACSL